MGTPNVPETQLIYEDGQKAIIKVLGAYNAATNGNTLVVQANTLFGSNNSPNAHLPILSVARVAYTAGLANGYIQLQWVGKNGSSNSDIINLGSRTSGDLPQYINNPLAGSNTSNVATANTTGDINLNVVGAEPFDSFSLFLTLNKENSQGGWANAYIAYNASDYNPGA